MDEMFTYQEGLDLAKRWGLESEYMACIADGMSPTEALEEWDLLPPETEEEREQYGYFNYLSRRNNTYAYWAYGS